MIKVFSVLLKTSFLEDNVTGMIDLWEKVFVGETVFL